MTDRLLDLLTLIATARQHARHADAERELRLAYELCRKLIEDAKREAGR